IFDNMEVIYGRKKGVNRRDIKAVFEVMETQIQQTFDKIENLRSQHEKEKRLRIVEEIRTHVTIVLWNGINSLIDDCKLYYESHMEGGSLMDLRMDIILENIKILNSLEKLKSEGKNLFSSERIPQKNISKYLANLQKKLEGLICI
ncbi:hypothetical protein ACFL0U_02605, partial [Pseudomonadota bacterium]